MCICSSDHIDVLKAAQIVYEEELVLPILLGRKEDILELKRTWL
jgi:malate dehydrogenase (oxaloacetate-decarboxylating)(NADP+)